ncbi:4-hydroxy-tetrahydrodipicolinate reductase [Fibrella sp. HMF5335]|uniref:4-hydroxy-tetrahydrodipicolinate reductase n=1 Tax=Fibrella rubiginis TaxID=2817060 RepID=A0A939K421_9BACT|nr:4-hydroxy-tetrahydrodipicolinate reductase [Fibrella rubiginis]MBO0939847.1 4-hydroxy-tetrahydrodipicolinate reductase [Fibrella rubiginis]
MTILLLGYGKMGKTIEQIALDRNHTIVGRIDVSNRADMDRLTDDAVDVVIEFSSPEAVVDNLRYCIGRGWAVVCGTTGWLSQRAEIEAAVRERGSAFFYASNYSIGVNLFFRLNKTLAKFMHNYPSYHVSMTEIHHTEKKDAPSGTAITLAEGLLNNLPHKHRWAVSEEGKPAAGNTDDAIVIDSVREGTVPGTHIVRFESDVDRIEISHVAHNRQGFAIGAVIAAEWLASRQGVFGMDDLLGE